MIGSPDLLVPEPVQIERCGGDRVTGGTDGDRSEGTPLRCRCRCRCRCLCRCLCLRKSRIPCRCGWRRRWRFRRGCFHGGCFRPCFRVCFRPRRLRPLSGLWGRVGHRDPYHRSAGAAQFRVRPLVPTVTGGTPQGDPLVVPRPVYDGRRRRPPVEHRRDGSAARTRVARCGVGALAPTGRAAHRHALGHGPIVLLPPPLVRLLTTFACPLTLLPDSRKYFPYYGSMRIAGNRWKGSPRGATGERIRQL
ncbi:hypothetical protein QF030_006416 [Streptomyces rishiriensis]|uniref:Uncharacterized protein n=1 Tax=Streptomyces rishiriensis TaxID=68264 RepID=A0ABU0NYK1_STRRH|nr:hypothetical protein [Streptomyces rishiriensis]